MKAVVKSRKILQDGRIIFDLDVVIKPAEGKTPAETKPANLMLTKPMLETLKELGDTAPKVGAEISVEWSVDAVGTQSEKWVTV